MNPNNLSRRALMRGAAASASLLSSSLRGLTIEQDPVGSARGPTLVVVFLRGGLDGLNLLVPFGESIYYDLRPGISIPRPAGDGTAIDLDGFFGLHPAASSLAPLFAKGLAVALPAVGHAKNTRSHFAEQDVWETGLEKCSLTTPGWLNRHLSTSRGRGPVRAMSLGKRLPRSMRGEASALSLTGLADLTFSGQADSIARTMEVLSKAYKDRGGSSEPASLKRGAGASLAALEHLQRIAVEPDTSKVEFPETDLGRRAKEASRLIRADVGLEVVELDLTGWDTHQDQGGVTGLFANNVREMSDALAALMRDLEDRLDDVMIVTVTEFGRTAIQNGNNGTDHGWAGCTLAMGGPVFKSQGRRDGPILGAWPGLSKEALNEERDLAHTTDFRDLYGELLGFLGNDKKSEVIPGHEFKPVRLI